MFPPAVSDAGVGAKAPRAAPPWSSTPSLLLAIAGDKTGRGSIGCSGYLNLMKIKQLCYWLIRGLKRNEKRVKKNELVGLCVLKIDENNELVGL
jgi:hypothetical protein